MPAVPVFSAPVLVDFRSARRRSRLAPVVVAPVLVALIVFALALVAVPPPAGAAEVPEPVEALLAVESVQVMAEAADAEASFALAAFPWPDGESHPVRFQPMRPWADDAVIEVWENGDLVEVHGPPDGVVFVGRPAAVADRFLVLRRTEEGGFAGAVAVADAVWTLAAEPHEPERLRFEVRQLPPELEAAEAGGWRPSPPLTVMREGEGGESAADADETDEAGRRRPLQSSGLFGHGVLEVAIQTDHEFWLEAGSDYLTAVYGAQDSLALASLPLQRDTALTPVITRLFLERGPNDPWQVDNHVDMIGELRTWWNKPANGRDTVPRDLVLMMSAKVPQPVFDTARQATVTYFGRAALSQVCSKTFGYGTAFAPPAPTRGSVKTVAHEIGHLIGASHTFELDPPIDDCVRIEDSEVPGGQTITRGTIMGYCNPFEWRFHPRTVLDIRALLTTKTCLEEVPSPWIESLENSVPVDGLELRRGESRFFRIELPAAHRDFWVQTTFGGFGSGGDVDLYLGTLDPDGHFVVKGASENQGAIESIHVPGGLADREVLVQLRARSTVRGLWLETHWTPKIDLGVWNPGIDAEPSNNLGLVTSGNGRFFWFEAPFGARYLTARSRAFQCGGDADLYLSAGDRVRSLFPHSPPPHRSEQPGTSCEEVTVTNPTQNPWFATLHAAGRFDDVELMVNADRGMTLGRPRTVRGLAPRQEFLVRFEVPWDALDLDLELDATGLGAAEAFVRHGAPPDPDANLWDRALFFTSQVPGPDTASIPNPASGEWFALFRPLNDLDSVTFLPTVRTSGTLPLINRRPVSGVTMGLRQHELFTFRVGSSADLLRVTTAGGSGDVDLWLVANQEPGSSERIDPQFYPGFWDASSATAGTTAETVEILQPAAGPWWILVHSPSGASGVTVEAFANAEPEFVPPPGLTDPIFWPPSAWVGDLVPGAASVWDPDGDPLTVTWDFGDGSPPAVGDEIDHVYRAAGGYTVSVEVDDGFASASRQRPITVVPAPADPVIDRLDAPTSATVGQLVTLTVFARDPNGDPLDYEWESEDGGAASGAATFDHVFQTPGTWKVSVVVSDPSGGQAESSALVTVTP